MCRLTEKNRALFSGSVSTGHKVIVIWPLRAPAAVKGLAYFFLAQARVEHPLAGLPGRLVSQMLGVPAGELCHPVSILVLMEAGNGGVAHRQ